MKLVVGLGNPGKEYINTRHNIGYSFVDYYLDKKFGDVNWTKKFDGKYTQVVVDKEKVIFLKPETFMNLSGNSVRKIVDYFDISLDDILIISDDLDLFVGNYKLRLDGSCGGHNGLRDIENKLGTNKYKRLKIGISNDKNSDTKDYVLGKFSKDELESFKTLFHQLSDVLDDYFKLNFTDLMSKYNRKNR